MALTLAFREKLVGKGLTTDSLLKKLKTLHIELSGIDQERIDVSSLGAVRKDLINNSIFHHKDKGVKVHAACCIADILRLYAPDAPYTQSELRDIFQFFFRQLATGLRGPQEAYYNEYFHLLESLATVKSVVLVCDLPSGDQVMLEIFRTCFALVRRDLAKKLELFMGDILTSIIDEAQNLSHDVIESIMAQFMEKDPKIENPGYRLAIHVANATAHKLAGQVCQYISDLIVPPTTESPRSSPSPAADYTEIAKTHTLIKRLHASSPALLQNVIPILEAELHTADVNIRVLATGTLGEMFADRGGADMKSEYGSTWASWLARKNDKAPLVRLKFVESCKGLLALEVVEDVLKSKLFDPDDKVRSAVCKLYSQVSYETALHRVSKSLLEEIARRGADKKLSVRTEALACVGRFWNLAFPEIEVNDPAAIRQFAWIPNEFLTMPMLKEMKPSTERVIHTQIMPLPSSSSSSSSKPAPKPVQNRTTRSGNSPNKLQAEPTTLIELGGNVSMEEAYTDRLLTIIRYLSPGAVDVLLKMSGVRVVRPTLLEHYIDICVKNNGGVIDNDEDEDIITAKLTAYIKHLAGALPDEAKATEHLVAFAKLNEGRLYKLLRTCIDIGSDIKTVSKASAEFIRRLTDSSPTIVPTMTILLRRFGSNILNQCMIPVLIKRIQKGNSSPTSSFNYSQSMSTMGGIDDSSGKSTALDIACHAHALLKSMAKSCPALFKSHVAELVKAIASTTTAGGVDLVGAALMGLAAVVKGGGVTLDKKTTERVRKFVLDSDMVHAKYAAQILAFAKGAEVACPAVVETIADNLDTADPELLVAHLGVLVQFTKYAPDAFETQSDIIMSFIIEKVLMVPCLKDDDNDDDTTPPNDEPEVAEWLEKDELTFAMRAKLISLKICRNRSLAHSNSETAVEMAAPALRMMVTLLDHRGSVTADSDEDPKLKSRMRLLSATSLLTLSMIDRYWNVIKPKFMTLAITIQDSCYNVRLAFLEKLSKLNLSTSKKLPACFNIIPMLTAHDPEPDTQRMAVSYMKYLGRKKDWTHDYLEMVFIRLLHFLGRHPDYGTSLGQMQDNAKYINFYLENVCTETNLPMLYTLAAKGKTVRDAQGDQFNERLYVMCELAQELMRVHAAAHSWSIPSFPGKLTLPRDILRGFQSAEASNEAGKKVYLPEDTVEWLESLGKSNKEKRPGTKRKRQPADQKPKRAPKAKKRKSTTKSGDDGNDDDSDDDIPSSEPPAPDHDDDEDEDPADEPAVGRGTRSRAAKAVQAKLRKTKAKKAEPEEDDDGMDTD